MTYNPVIVGVDPGKNGGIACLVPGATRPSVWKMPENEERLWAVLHQQGILSCDLVVMEKVRSSPQMGVVSAFTFGWGYGALWMAFTALGCKIEEVTPQKWQKALGCLSKGDKNFLKEKAQELYPTTKVTLWNSDALLIATYGKEFLK